MPYTSKFDKIWNASFAIGFFVLAILEFFSAVLARSIGGLIVGIGMFGGGIVLAGRLWYPENIVLRRSWLWVTFTVTVLGVIIIFLVLPN